MGKNRRALVKNELRFINLEIFVKLCRSKLANFGRSKFVKETSNFGILSKRILSKRHRVDLKEPREIELLIFWNILINRILMFPDEISSTGIMSNKIREFDRNFSNCPPASFM